MNIPKSLLSIAFLFLHFALFAQENPVLTFGCGSDEQLRRLRKEEDFVKREAQINAKIRDLVLVQQNRIVTNSKSMPIKSNAVIAGTIYLPVVFHVISQNPSAITDLMIQNAVQDLNDAFAHKGIYGTNPMGANTGIQFCLAKTAPDGGATTGIERIKSYYENLDVDMETAMPGNLSNWDKTKYVNIYLVNSIKGEIPPTVFSCGTWKRMGYGGYASAGNEIVVSGLSAPLLAHEMGHYLSLLHTFQGMNCVNNNCLTDGDLVCDTPPDRSQDPSSCLSPQNSCATDTLSGPFTTDQPDNVANFMDYGSLCPSMFTPGQAMRMQAFLSIFAGGSLKNSNRCNVICSVEASFQYFANPHPKIGDTVHFVNTSLGSTNFEWSVDGNFESNSQDFTHVFDSAKKVVVNLKAWDATHSCFASYTSNLLINCGVDARFSPNKRVIASSNAIYLDSILFVNTSFGATDFQWYLTDSTGANFQLVSNQKDFGKAFTQSGVYRVKLIANNGACVSNSPEFMFNVWNPKPDGSVGINEVVCYKKDSLRIVFTLVNNGYDTIPAGMKIQFYDRYPGMLNPILLSPNLITTQPILGRCSATFTQIVAAARVRQDSIMVVFDEDSLITELSESNNYAIKQKFQMKVGISPMDTIVNIHSSLPVSVINFNTNPLTQISWSPANLFACDTCGVTQMTVPDSIQIKVVAINDLQCIDSAYANIKVFPLDIAIHDSSIHCYHNDSLLVTTQIELFNGYTQLKKAMDLVYFDKDSTDASAILLGKILLDQSTPFLNGKYLVNAYLKSSATSRVFSYINRNQSQFEDSIANNQSSIVYPYVPFAINFPINEMELIRNQVYPIGILHFGEPYSSLKWTPSFGIDCDTCSTVSMKTHTLQKYQVLGTTLFGCIDTANITIKPYYLSHLILPNVFSPNGDGRNDYFYVIAGKEVQQVNQFQIFNRWGERIFQAKEIPPNDMYQGWNGTFKGKPAEAGTYVYYLQISMLDGTKEVIKGNITLIR